MTTPDANFVSPIIDRLQQSRRVLSRADVASLGLPPSVSEFDELIAKLEQQRLHAQNRYTLLMLGETNAGKSTILNVLFNLTKERRLPVGDQPITAIPIRFTYWDKSSGQPEAQWNMHDGSVRTLPWQDALRPADQSVQAAGRDTIREVVLRLDHPLLINVDILDMPGTGSMFFDHTTTTRDYLDTIDLVTWVIGFDEPDREGYRDLQIVRSTDVPMIVIFNAWGSIDPTIDATIAKRDQDAFEQTIINRFRVSNDHYFRIYGRKCIEMMDSGRAVPAIFGVEALTSYLIDSYLGDLAQRHIDRRNEVRSKVARNLRDIKHFLENSQIQWNMALTEASAQDQTFARDEEKTRELSIRVAEEVRERANVCTRKIVQYLEMELTRFVQEQVSLTNPSLYKHMLNRKGMEQHFTREFEKRLKQQHIEAMVNDFYQDCVTLMRHEWVKFIQDYDLDVSSNGVPVNIKLKDLPIDRITNEAVKQVRALVGKMLLVMGGIVVAVLLTWFGPIIGIVGTTSTLLVDTSAFGPAVISAATGLAGRLKGASMNDNIERIIRQDLETRRDEIKILLVNAVMDGPQQEFVKKFAEQRDKRRAKLNGQQSTIRDGMRAVTDAILACSIDQPVEVA